MNGGPNLQFLNQLIGQLGGILNAIIPLIIALTVIVFFYGLFKYVWGGGGDQARKGSAIMLAGIVSLFIMLSLWGIITLLQNTFNVQGNNAYQQGGGITPPAVPQLGS